MSPTTAAVAPLRFAGTLLVAAALVAGPAATALADPSASASPTPTASPTASASPSPTAPPSATPTTSPSPSAEPTPTGSDPQPSPSATATPRSGGSPGATRERVAGASTAQLAAAAGVATPQASHAADFVARTLAAGGDHYVYPGGYFDGGNTIDGIIALAASGSGRTQMTESLAYLEANLGTYTGTEWGDLYVGGTAKTLIGVVAAGADPRSFGSTDLVSDLQGLEVPGGRFSDTGSGDYTITITQALAVIALARAGETLTTASVDTLLAQQCADGGFRSAIDDPEGCTSDPDVTAFAAQALVAAGATTEAGRALDRLAALQGADGSVRSEDGAPNANTTGVAAQAFAAGGRDTDLAQAQAFLTSLQYGCSAPAALRGGLAFSPADRSPAVVEDSDLRATPQGTLGLTGQSLLSVRVPEGATAGTTALPCTAPTTTPPATPTQPASGPGATVGAGSAGDPTPEVAGSPTGSLARTGTDPLLPLGLGLALVLVGALTVVASRRRGAHA